MPRPSAALAILHWTGVSVAPPLPVDTVNTRWHVHTVNTLTVRKGLTMPNDTVLAAATGLPTTERLDEISRLVAFAPELDALDIRDDEVRIVAGLYAMRAGLLRRPQSA
jgi:hypothetical protein